MAQNLLTTPKSLPVVCDTLNPRSSRETENLAVLKISVVLCRFSKTSSNSFPRRGPQAAIFISVALS